ncbi:phasin family protein [Plantactinospora sp. KBS50]|uniref:phasin family protein n=1 Tax=Plantactinospora sp. KBS50 TaxID=2024580 RepID=UPI001E514C17|nr:hypothetical protein [Plantactinospora sp. KBS50]
MQDAWRAYLEMALGLTESSRRRAETAVRRVVGQGGATATQLQSLAEELFSAGMANREALSKLVRFEVDRALGAVGLATAEEVAELTARIHQLERELRDARGTAVAPAASAMTPQTAAPSTVAKKAVAKKAVAKKAVAKTTVAKKAVAKKAVAKKAVAKKVAPAEAPGAPTGEAGGPPASTPPGNAQPGNTPPAAAQPGNTPPGTKRVAAKKLPATPERRAAARRQPPAA